MARMIPPYISEEVQSKGERKIFDLFDKDSKTEDWVVLHSLGLSRHVRRLYGEIDFVVLAPKLGIFCLEVKSGYVFRLEGIWHFTDRTGATASKPYGPFEQARDAMFSLKKAIEDKFGRESHLNNLVYGYGVMFPDVSFPAEGLDQDPWKIYDRASRRFPISDYIEKLARNKRNKVKNQCWFHKTKSLPTRKDIRALVDFLRGDFERITSPVEKLDDIEEQLLQYTEEQYQSLDQLRDNPRCLFQGAAGTGKTMIALESTRRRLFANQRVLLVCYNKLLGHWLTAQFPRVEQGGKLGVNSFHRLLTEISDTSSDSVKNDDYFNHELPLMALEAIDRGTIEPFDCLVMDEGQDLLRSEYLDVFDGLLKGGIADGYWEVYSDLEKQAIYTNTTASEMLDTLEKRANFARFRLKVNCRNTRPIGKQAALLSGFERPPFLPTKIEGLPVNYSFYKNQEDEIKKLTDLLIKFQKQKIPRRNISILSPFKFENSVVSGLNHSRFKLQDLTKTRTGFKASSTITFSTIQSFKGLENAYIVLTDIKDLNNDEFRSLLYVGMSRARVELSVFINTQAKEYFNLLKGLEL